MKLVDQIIQLDQPGAPYAVVEETMEAGTYRTRKIGIVEKWHREGKIEAKHRAAGLQFEMDFNKAGLTERYSIQSFDRVDRSATDHTPANILDARDRVRQAMYAMGTRGGAIAWDVLGLGHSLSQFCKNHQWAGNSHFASGLLVGALDSLAAHYRT